MLTARQSRQDEEKHPSLSSVTYNCVSQAIWNQRKGDTKTEDKALGKVPEKSGKTFCKNILCGVFSHQRT